MSDDEALMPDGDDIDRDERAREDFDYEHDGDAELEEFLQERDRKRGKRWPR